MRSENAGPGSEGAKRADRDQRDGGRAPMVSTAGFNEVRYMVELYIVLPIA